MSHIILFDGVCHFCDRSVQFILKRDKKAVYQFASLQSDIGQMILDKYGAPADVDSLVYVTGNQYYVKSSAALRICKHLKGLWKLCSLLLMVPKPLRDPVYTIVARNRYKWFGKKKAVRCHLPK
ncbi:thiol-disulfide oxidoreductase DCC family protein [Lentibacillus cibarius]|uniref:thiol-disulfide oxidoreductase DCC family protein n=1 Tax=Lentibacillus cibarius TaxID=2583219 RepID=UPI0026AA3DB5|nr:DCC1-like thiol-disulfide oxidoreductase family protein [Lentibacillus cibarius]